MEKSLGQICLFAKRTTCFTVLFRSVFRPVLAWLIVFLNSGGDCYRKSYAVAIVQDGD